MGETQTDWSQLSADQKKTAGHTIADKLKIAEELRDLQEKLAPHRAANRERAKGKVQIRIKTR